MFLGAAPVTSAAAAPPVRHSQQLSAFDLFALAERAQSEGRKNDAFALYDALAKDPVADIRAEARFRKAALLTSDKRYADAAVVLRAILDEMPQAVRVRLELARVLALLGDEDAARRAIRQARASGLPPDVVVTVEQFARALRSTRPFGGSLELSLVPDSNINRATQARTLDTVLAPLTLSADGRAQTGLGGRVAASAFARVPLTDQVSLLPRVSGIGTFYKEPGFNDASASVSVGAEWRIGRDKLTPSAGGSWRRFGGKPYAKTRSLSFDWLHPIGSRSQMLAGFSASRASYRLNTLQNGALYDARLSLEHALGARSGFSLAVGGQRQAAEDPGYATRSGSVSALAWREIGKSTVFGSIEGRRLRGDARIFLFTDKRREWFAAARTGATLRQFTVRSFAPVVRVGMERNRSTVALYDYRRVFVEFGIVRAF